MLRWRGHDSRDGARRCASRAREPPTADAVQLNELRSASLAHLLGYFDSEDIVIFGYCPGGGDVVWKDGRSPGLATGARGTFLEEIAPLAARTYPQPDRGSR